MCTELCKVTTGQGQLVIKTLKNNTNIILLLTLFYPLLLIEHEERRIQKTLSDRKEVYRQNLLHHETMKWKAGVRISWTLLAGENKS